MNYHIGICDDAKSVCTDVENYVYEYFKETGDCVEVYSWDTGEKCCKDLNNKIHIDILFLDIELPGKNGVAVGKYIRELLSDANMQIVYISSKMNYAMELFQVHPYDFLIKPVEQGKVNELLGKLLLVDKQDKRFYRYTYHRNQYRIPIGKIQYLMSRNKHIEIHLYDNSVQEFTGKLKTESEKLPSQFVMIGQSYIVNLKYVVECYYDHVVMQNGSEINISQPNRALFRTRLREYNECM